MSTKWLSANEKVKVDVEGIIRHKTRLYMCADLVGVGIDLSLLGDSWVRYSISVYWSLNIYNVTKGVGKINLADAMGLFINILLRMTWFVCLFTNIDPISHI